MGNSLGGEDFHVLGYLLQVVADDALENAREYQGVVYLVVEVASAACVNECSALDGLVRVNFGVWICQCEYDGFLVHCLHPFFFQCPSDRNADKYVCTFQDFF